MRFLVKKPLAERVVLDDSSGDELVCQVAEVLARESAAINRVGIVQMREHFANCGMVVDWIASIPAEPCDAAQLREAATAVALSSDDLMVKGLSVFLNKLSQHQASTDEARVMG